jgi:imipenem/basic amino acid-specific outer membrane pore
MRQVIISFLPLMIISINIYGETFKEALLNTAFEGNLRVGYQNQIPQPDGLRDDEYALGLNLHAETASYHGVQIGATLFTSYGNGEEGFESVPFFDAQNDNYAILGEAYLKGTFSNTTFILGRQSFDTPFADRDDIGMVPNTFEAYTLLNKDIKDTTIFLSQVQKWSGVDSDDPGTFTNVNGSKGMQVLGVTYEGLKNTLLSGWFYHLSDEVKITYLEAEYADETENYTYGGRAQYAYQDYDNTESSRIYGASLFCGVKKLGFTTTIAYNKTYGTEADNFFGGGPFVTNAEHNTLKEAGPDGNIILYTFEWDASVADMEGLTFAINVDGHHGDLYHAKEYDVAMAYAYSEVLHFSAIYSEIDDKDESFNNLRVFANYSF